jgi:hypothetical protein
MDEDNGFEGVADACRRDGDTELGAFAEDAEMGPTAFFGASATTWGAGRAGRGGSPVALTGVMRMAAYGYRGVLGQPRLDSAVGGGVPGVVPLAGRGLRA